ncbi:uncharacterized protein LOC143152878 [Ptiloglossa arizonensis]|uniref:uncharacterized protein LOC143152878 n=1 Tax=Ptiloglossa arizonensis TaxID=3350558 RepID=UPI003FA02116
MEARIAAIVGFQTAMHREGRAAIVFPVTRMHLAIDCNIGAFDSSSEKSRRSVVDRFRNVNGRRLPTRGERRKDFAGIEEEKGQRGSHANWQRYHSTLRNTTTVVVG